MRIKTIAIALIMSVFARAGAGGERKIGICQVASIAALNENVKGIKDRCKDAKIRVELCQCNAALASQIIEKFVGDEVDAIVTVGTLPTQIACKAAKKQGAKIVFTAVTEPAEFKNNGMTGVSDFVSTEAQLEIIKEIQPDLKKLAFIYNTGEANSASILADLRKLVGVVGIELVEVGVQKSADVAQAAQDAAKKADAIYVSNDDTVLSALLNVVKAANKRKKPVYVSDTDEITKGCLAALGPKQFALGQQTGAIVERVLNGEAASSIPVEYPKETELVINLDAAKKLGMEIPKSVLAKADRLVGPAG